MKWEIRQRATHNNGIYTSRIQIFSLNGVFFIWIVVYCPIEDFDGVDNQLIFNETRNSVETRKSSFTCSGSLKIIYAGGKSLTSQQNIQLGGDHTEYPSLNKGFPDLKITVVLNVEAYGCNCLEIYENPRYAGETEIVPPGEPHYLSVNMGSIRKVKCSNDYDDYHYD